MRTEEAILEEYRKGDFCSRLNLYLEHRDLRHLFTRIDSDERALPHVAAREKRASGLLGAARFLRHRIAR